jgi:hypothetical protein
MIFKSDGSVRLTPRKLNTLRAAAARNGHTVNTIANREQLLQATLDGLPAQQQDDLLAYLEKELGTSVP